MAIGGWVHNGDDERPGWWQATDGYWYPPEEHPLYPLQDQSPPQYQNYEFSYVQPARRARRILRWLFVGVLLLLLGGCVARVAMAGGGDEGGNAAIAVPDGSGASAASYLPLS